MGWIVRILLAASVSVLMVSGCAPSEEAGGGPPRGAPVFPVTTAKVERGTITEVASLVGSTRFPRRTLLKSEAEGRVLEVTHREGIPFQKDDVLVRLDDSNYRVTLAQEEASLQRSKRVLEELQAGTRPEVLSQLAASVAAAEASLRETEDELTRTQRLFDQDVQTEAELIRARAARDQAKARLDETRARHEEARLGPREVEIRVAEADVLVQEARVAEVRHNLAKTIIRAPYDGVVLELHTDEGDFLDSGDALMQVASNEIGALLEVPDRYVRHLTAGRTFTLTADAFPGRTLDAEVVAIIPSADPQSRNFLLRARLLDTDRLAAGMFVRARLPVLSREDALLIPDDAVLLNGRETLIFTVDDQNIVSQHVATLGLANETHVELVNPVLEPGTTLVTTGNEVLYPGAQVNPGGPPGDSPQGAGGGEEARDGGE